MIEHDVLYMIACVPFFKRIYLFNLFFFWKIKCAGGRETERKMFSPMIHLPSDQTGSAKPMQSQEPGTSSWSSTWVQGLKALDSFFCFPRPQEELGMKRGCQNQNRGPYVMTLLRFGKFFSIKATMLGPGCTTLSYNHSTIGLSTPVSAQNLHGMILAMMSLDVWQRCHIWTPAFTEILL